MVAHAPHPPAMTNVWALPSGTQLAGDFRIERVLGAGGFGITYLARDLVLDRAVTIKEYFPVDFAARGNSNNALPRSQDCAGDYKWGLDRFIEEAKTLAQFDHRNIVKVFQYFQANATAYMVLQFEEGRSLKAWQNGLRRAPRQNEIDRVVAPLLDALELIHNADFLHRDIAPDNIIVRLDGSPVLIDFGSARGDIARHSRTVSALVKPGYSPYEQYAETGSQQGPWTDIYALGATLYHVVGGKRPLDSPSRIVKDEYVSAHSAALGSYRQRFLDGIDHALQLDIDRRPRSIAEWRGELMAPDEKASIRLFRRKAPVGAEAAARDPAPTVRLKAPPIPVAKHVEPSALPPPPDAPGRKGGFLDFLEALKPRARDQNNSPKSNAAPASLAAALAGAEPRAAGLAVGTKGEAAGASQSGNAGTPSKPGTLKAKRRPRPVRPASSSRGRLRPLVYKLMVGAAIAALAVNYQDQIPTIASIGKSPLETGDSTMKSVVVAGKPLPPPVLLPSPIEAHQGSARDVRFSPDGTEVISTGLDATVKRWNARTGALLGTFPVDIGPPTSIAVAEGRVVTGHGDGSVAVWSLTSGSRLAYFKQNEAAVWSVAFADSSARVLAASHDWKIRLWDAGIPSTPVHTFDGHANAVQSIRSAPGDGAFVSGSADKTVKLWDLQNLDIVRTYRGHADFVTAVALSPDGRRVAGANLSGQIRLWSTQSSKLLRILGRHEGQVTGLAFTTDGNTLASASGDGTIRLWNLTKRRAYRALAAGAPVNAIAFSPDGQSIAAALGNGSLRFWATRGSRGTDDERS